jgi:hypothetical protein
MSTEFGAANSLLGSLYESIRLLAALMPQISKAMANSPIQAVVEWHADPVHYRQESRRILAKRPHQGGEATD